MSNTLLVVVAFVIAAAIALFLRSRGAPGNRNTEIGMATTFFGPDEIESYVRNHVVEIVEEHGSNSPF